MRNEILGPDSVDVSKLSPREFKDQRRAASELYNAFIYSALKDMKHGLAVPDSLRSEVSYNE
jgi:hypothetical protein